MYRVYSMKLIDAHPSDVFKYYKEFNKNTTFVQREYAQRLKMATN